MQHTNATILGDRLIEYCCSQHGTWPAQTSLSWFAHVLQFSAAVLRLFLLVRSVPIVTVFIKLCL